MESYDVRRLALALAKQAEIEVNEAFEKMTNEELIDSLIDANRGSSDILPNNICITCRENKATIGSLCNGCAMKYRLSY